MKVGIVTLGNSTNYGGVLQAAALYKVLLELGYEPELITTKAMPKAWNSVRQYVVIRNRLYGHQGFATKLRFCGGILKTLLSNVHYRAVQNRIRNFNTFIQNNLTFTNVYFSMDEMRKECGHYDAYITGSDQVWNFDFNYGSFDQRYLLAFAPAGALKYSYAASTGGKKSEAYIQKLAGCLQSFNRITVREESLQKQLEGAGINCETVLDPTLLLTCHEWEQFENAPKMNIPQHYILTYYLERDSRKDSYINTIASALNMPVIDIGTYYGHTDYKRIIADQVGPAEFLYLVHHADYVITNSFHMTAFSIQYHKKFIALPRDGQESRVEDLLKKLHVENHLVHNKEEWKVIEEEYPDPMRLIEDQRSFSVDFLKKIGDDYVIKSDHKD